MVSVCVRMLLEGFQYLEMERHQTKHRVRKLNA